MLLNPGLALLTGVCAGAVSTYCFSFLSPMLKRRGLTDACGIGLFTFFVGTSRCTVTL
jgi:hypothetical protein